MSDMAVDFEPLKINVEQFFRMGEADIFGDRHVELLDGFLVELSPIGSAHASMQARVFSFLHQALAQRATIIGPMTLPLSQFDAPQPDVIVAAHKADGYFDRLPTIQEVYVLVEIAGSSLPKDVRLKRRLYARFGIMEYLVVDIAGKNLRRYTQPSDGDYKIEERLSYDDAFTLTAIPDVVLHAGRLLPPT